MFKSLFFVTAFTIATCVAHAKLSDKDRTDCLAALNSNSVTFKNKITVLNQQGTEYIVKNEDGSSSFYNPSGGYRMGEKSLKCQTSAEFNSDDMLGVMLTRVAAFNNEPSNSDKNIRAITKACKAIMNSPIKSPMLKNSNQTGTK